MKILLVGNYLSDSQSSMQRFELLMERSLRLAGHQVRSVRPRSILGRLCPSWKGLGKGLGYVDKFGFFPPELSYRAEWADVVHICDQGNSFYVPYIRSIPHILTCHDLLAVRSAHGEIPQKRTRWSGRRLQHLILTGLRKAQHIVCVSEATRRDLLRVAGLPLERASCVYNSLSYPYSRMDPQEAQVQARRLRIDTNRPFLLHVGGNHWYKNRLGVLRIFAYFHRHVRSAHHKLVMVGEPWTQEMRHFVLQRGMQDVVFEITGASDEDLRALYSTATLLLFPSLHEGFGWPILEAQACGCPVVTSCRAPMDEIGGSAAWYIDPEQPESAALGIRAALGKLSDMRASGLRNVERFSVAQMIDGYVSAYRRVSRAAGQRKRNENRGLTTEQPHSHY